MKQIFTTAATAGLLFVCMTAAAHAAGRTACEALISAEGRATRVEGSDDFKHYNGHVPPDLAQRRAISAWQGHVADRCPGYSAVWRRATNAYVACDAGMGHDDCTAAATPRRKLFSWFLPH